ncbi:amidase signature enzyme [Coemansia reversa NRRL 1564]|uniref:Glutamyl-tRNA(Gln) amidotransferase subunit A, mitochondrial n=1 Tax=Coemansia reversa (strain ATCC 12441 / NRRL 1564) TaxID=763665 RepID=A0A2G5BFX4_COERN|nr:amidase signature enzyme [Coemansia reversa NRRL 1564]|eukprot:PIA17900.1 amidase signature enzyme [Coemansia reversa NRRL 1564]
MPSKSGGCSWLIRGFATTAAGAGSSIGNPITIFTSSSALGEIDRQNPRLNALASSVPPAAVSDTLDKTIHGPLQEWPVVVKSNIATGGTTTTCASQTLAKYISPFTATAVDLLQKAGAVVVGTSNMDEFGMGSKTQFGIYGPAYNPHQIDASRHSPGGSSGGSAAAVASGMCRIALGSDTGGSVRLPAAWCGVVGFKPTYGRISRHGLVSYASSLDAVGILASTVHDIETAYHIMAVPDSKDMTCMSGSLRDRIDSERPLAGIRIGIPQEFWVEELTESALDAWRHGAQQLAEAGCEIVKVSLPHIPSSLPAYYTLALAEASSNLARYDGIRFGTRSSVRTQILALANASLKYAATRSEGFGPEVQRRILLGTYVMSDSAYQHYYLPSQRIRQLIQREFDQIFALPNALCNSSIATLGNQHRPDGVDAILFPTSNGTAPLQHDSADESSQVSSYVNDVMTVPANLAGIPALSVPVRHSHGMPIGLQLAAQYGDDNLLLQIASHVRLQSCE